MLPINSSNSSVLKFSNLYLNGDESETHLYQLWVNAHCTDEAEKSIVATHAQ